MYTQALFFDYFSLFFIILKQIMKNNDTDGSLRGGNLSVNIER
jgi:hypothetical protein